MSQSKISISTDQILSWVSMIAAKKNDGDFRLSEKEVVHDKTFFKSEVSELSGEGYPINNLNIGEQIVFLKLNNKGDAPSTNIKVSLILKVYKTKNTYDSESRIIKSERVLAKEYPYNIFYSYMGSDEIKFVDLYMHKKHLRETELILLKIEANGHKYFKESLWKRLKVFKKWANPTIIEHFTHPMLFSIGDSEDAAKVYGSKVLWSEETEEEF